MNGVVQTRRAFWPFYPYYLALGRTLCKKGVLISFSYDRIEQIRLIPLLVKWKRRVFKARRMWITPIARS